MKTLKSILCFIVIAWFLFLTFSCRKETNPSWNIDVLAPLVKSTLSINNIVADSILHENPDNSLEIVYSSYLSSFSTHNIFTIPDYIFDSTYKSPIQAFFPGGTTFAATTTQHVKAIPGGAELTQGTMLSGKMLLSVASSVKGKLDFTLMVPGFTEPSGNIFQTGISIPAGTITTQGKYNGVFDLSGFKMNFTGPSGLSVNTIAINYSVVIDPSQDSIPISINDSIRISCSFVDLIPAYAKGYFGDTVSSITDNTPFGLFNHLAGGTVDFEKVDVSMNIENSVGVDARITVNDLISFNSHTGGKVPLAHTIIGTPLDIKRGIDNNGMPPLPTASLLQTLIPISGNL